MAYSNGYNNTTVLPKLSGQLGWRTDSTLATALKNSVSGRYWDDGSFHSLVTVANVKATAPDQTDWDVFFTAKQNAVISKALNGVFNLPEFVDDAKFYTPDQSEVEQLVSNSGKAVGFKISVAKDFDKTVLLNYLELYFDGAATFNVYLFKQGSKTALKTKEVTTVANTKTQVDLTDWVLNYKEAGIYYVVYFQDDLGSVKAIREQVEYPEPCYFCAEPIETDVISGTDFNRQSPSIPGQPSGLNTQASSFRDFTNHILLQPHLFVELLGLVNAYTCIEEAVYSIRSSRNERILKDQVQQVGIQLDLNGAAPISDSPQVMGLKQRIDRETARLKKAFYPRPKSQTVDYADY